MPPLSATFDGLQGVTDAQMPLRVFLTRVLEQCVVFEDVTTSLSRVPARSGGAALPVSRLGDKALRVASVTFRACCGAVMVNRRDRLASLRCSHFGQRWFCVLRPCESWLAQAGLGMSCPLIFGSNASTAQAAGAFLCPYLLLLCLQHFDLHVKYQWL